LEWSNMKRLFKASCEAVGKRVFTHYSFPNDRTHVSIALDIANP